MHPAQISAKIYPFPIRDRAISNAARKDVPSIDPRMIPGPDVLSGAGWYHEAAMQDARRPAKH